MFKKQHKNTFRGKLTLDRVTTPQVLGDIILFRSLMNLWCELAICLEHPNK